MSQSLARVLRRRWRGYELEPGEAEIGRAWVGWDGGGISLLAERLALTDRRLLVLKARFSLALILVPLLLTFLLQLHPFFFPLLVIVFGALNLTLLVRPVAAQRREELVACAREPAANFLMKPKLGLWFRDGTRWRVYNPAKGANRLDALVALMHKGGIEVAAAADAPARSTGTGQA